MAFEDLRKAILEMDEAVLTLDNELDAFLGYSGTKRFSVILNSNF
jgi:hypothetical protein